VDAVERIAGGDVRSAGAAEPIWLLDALTRRMPSPLLGKVPLGMRVVPDGSTPMKLPRILLPSLSTRMPSPANLTMSRPLTTLPPLPAPSVKPVTFAPAPMPSS